MVDAVRFAGSQAFHESEAQRQRQGSVKSKHHQGLAQIFALAALRIERRVGDAQDLRGQRGIQAQGLGDLAHFDIGVPREFDDVRRHTRRGWKTN